MVREGYWDVEDTQVIAKTGKPLAHWMGALQRFGAASKKTAESVEHLQALGVPRYWARTLTTHFLKREA
jgi:hypothetical protein